MFVRGKMPRYGLQGSQHPITQIIALEKGQKSVSGALVFKCSVK